MELEDMKALWEDNGRKLDTIVRLNSRLLQKSTLDKADTAMKRLSRWLLVEFVLNLGAVFLLGAFAANHLREARFLVPAAALDLYVIAQNIGLIRQLVGISNIDYDAPVLVIQKKLELLKIQRIGLLKWTLLFAPLMWVPMLIVAFQGLFGVDVYSFFDPVWIVANLLLGVAVIPLAVWVSKRYADRMNRSPFVQRLMREIAGSYLNAATGYLKALARFEESELM